VEKKTVDGDTGQIGPEVAEHLGIPHVAYVSEIKKCDKEGFVTVSQMGEYRYFTELVHWVNHGHKGYQRTQAPIFTG